MVFHKFTKNGAQGSNANGIMLRNGEVMLAAHRGRYATM